jgi:glycosyltransferase involved in cell wall biosynthesis
MTPIINRKVPRFRGACQGVPDTTRCVRAMARHDVAIYAPFSRGYYDRARGRAGGAERQMTLLARALSAQGLDVAHIVYPPLDPIPLPNPHLTLVHRPAYAGDRPVIGRVLEAIRVWRVLRLAGGRVMIARMGSPAVGIAALFSKIHHRRFIFSSANDSDFTSPRISSRFSRMLYRLGVRLADVVVVQSQDQVTLAREAFPSLRRVVHVPSFVEAAPLSTRDTPEPTLFLWIGRVVRDKQPMRYVELARELPEIRFVMIPVPEGRADELGDVRAASERIPNLELLDPLPHGEVMALIARAIAVVNTSQFEGMPNVFLEAWARGIPVLTLEFDPDGVIARRELGVAAGGSWDRFVAGARELWEGRSGRKELSRRTRAYVERVHSIDAVGERWSWLIDRLGHDR